MSLPKLTQIRIKGKSPKAEVEVEEVLEAKVGEKIRTLTINNKVRIPKTATTKPVEATAEAEVEAEDVEEAEVMAIIIMASKITGKVKHHSPNINKIKKDFVTSANNPDIPNHTAKQSKPFLATWLKCIIHIKLNKLHQHLALITTKLNPSTSKVCFHNQIPTIKI